MITLERIDKLLNAVATYEEIGQSNHTVYHHWMEEATRQIKFLQHQVELLRTKEALDEINSLDGIDQTGYVFGYFTMNVTPGDDVVHYDLQSLHTHHAAALAAANEQGMFAHPGSYKSPRTGDYGTDEWFNTDATKMIRKMKVHS